MLKPDKHDRVLVIDDAARERLKTFIEDITPKIAARVASVRAEGAAARAAGRSAGACPHYPGSWMANRWLEGWSGTIVVENGDQNRN